MLNRLLQWLREVWQKMIGTSSIKRALNVDLEISSPMVNALDLWSKIYINQASWLSDYVKSLNLGASIAGEIARSITIEMEMEVRGSARATFLMQQMEMVLPQLRKVVEYGNAKGGVIFKPYVKGDGIAVDYVQADQFYPVSFDANGSIISCVFSDQRRIGDTYYTRLEYHDFTDAGYFVKNVAFRSSTKDTLGNEIPLANVDAWAELAPEATITGVDAPLFAYYRYPLANNIDPTSPLGVSCYARAVDLIEQADWLWSDFLWEFESGKRALYVDELAFDRGDDDKPKLPDKRLIRTLKGAGQIGKDAEFFKEWTPTLREANLLNGLNAILKRIEFVCGLAYGTLSDPEEIDRTATEILSSKQRSAATVVDGQKALQTALDQLLYAMNVWADIENLASRGGYEAIYEFDDSLVTDSQQQFSHDQTVVGMKAMPKVEFLVRNYGLSEEKAREWIAQAQAEQPEIDLFAEENI